jgi:hypothetical protein
MEDLQQLWDQIEAFEKSNRSQKAQSFREKLLKKTESANNEDFLFIVDKLIKEKTTVNGIEEANSVESYYLRLHDLTEKRIGRDHGLAALAKRKLARIFVIQGRYQEAVLTVEKALPILSSHFGDDSFEVNEAMNSVTGWYKYFDPAKAKALIEREWLEHPLCEHLTAIEDYLRTHGAKMWREERNTRPTVKVFVRAQLDVNSIRQKLTLDPCVEDFEDPPGPHSSYLKGFACKIHPHFIVGDYEKSAGQEIIS